ncbi:MULTISPECIES: helix-turn-helix domain-containing protein [unclassified Pantoea]|uniref:helix-turn-helix domain-containing protein n=1 Tax=unclassified Pantoea TaxID=2630326 RepID=UPI001CD818E6|nr:MULTISPECIES: S24 family peptidase [unclassified Pantoea]MCA1176676.1 helix-turn-helix domain-containing protein [Pantoea sp. alder69]MCA1251589.1 helix-turn-helix domain-containing protein [Pantoea sp. alder70]MCA1264280.1 helix-turn-helix domain-containing protein [Pantoea sp. alder81]
MSNNIGERIKEKREELGVSQAELAKLCGWPTASRLGNYESGTRRVSAEDAAVLAEVLKVTPSYLLFGDAGSVIYSNFEYPICNAVNLLSPADSTFNKSNLEKLQSTVKAGQQAFWFEVTGHSMTSPLGLKPSFPDGMMILCDPDIPPTHGDFCLIELKQEREIAFKKFSKEDGQVWLEPLNTSPRYQTLPLSDSIRVIGKILSACWPPRFFI